jgi:Helix-turn-helix domain
MWRGAIGLGLELKREAKEMTQEERIINHLMSGKSLTAAQAYDKFDCMRLAARIYNIRTAIKVKVQMLKLPNGKMVAQYRI